MKKKLTLLGVLVVSFLFCVVGVKGLERVYPEYEVGDKLYWNETKQEKCFALSIENDDNCVEYTVSEASDSKKNTIKVVDSDSQEATFQKSWFIVGYVLKATKETEILFPAEIEKLKLNNYDPAEQEGVTEIIYFNNSRDIDVAFENAEKFDHIFTDRITPSNMTIKEDTYATITSVNDTCHGGCHLTVNGVLKTEFLSSKKIDGNGTINLSYLRSVEPTELIAGTPLWYAYRFSTENISGVRVNIINEELRDGLPFGYDSPIGKQTEEDAQERINMYKSVLNADGFDLVLDNYMLNVDDKYYNVYYGKLVKKNTTTAEVKNPKTSDSIINIIAIMSLASIGAFFAFKKIKNN